MSIKRRLDSSGVDKAAAISNLENYLFKRIFCVFV
jgi:hypothetical protein